MVALTGPLVLATAGGTSRQREVWAHPVEHTDSEGTLNKHGQQGWELAAACRVASDPSATGQVRPILTRRKN